MVDLVARDVQRDAAIRSVRFSAGTVIAGDAGVGKTSLASSVADVLAERGVPVVRVLATAAGRSIPFAALGPLLPVDSTDFHPALVPGMVLRRLGELSPRAKPLLLVDDAQLLDDHSAAALLSVVHQQGARALVTVRLGGRPPDAVTALWKDGLLDRIDLQPFDLAGAGDLLRSRLGGEVATVTIGSLWEHSQGNPLYLTELVRFGVATGRLSEVGGVWWWPGDTEVPPRLGELLHRRIEDVTPPGPRHATYWPLASRCRTTRWPPSCRPKPSWSWTSWASSPVTPVAGSSGSAFRIRCCSRWPHAG